MRVLFSSRPAYGHLYPLMPLAFALREAGHEVVFATGAAFVERVGALGFATRAAGATILWAEEEAIRRDPPLADLPPHEKPTLGARMFGGILPPRTIADLAPLIEEQRPALVVYEGADFGAALAARAAGVPAVMHSYGAPWPDHMVELMTPLLDEHAAALGLEPGEIDPTRGEIYLDISPPSLGDASALGHPQRLPLRPVAFSEPGAGTLPDRVFADPERPRVYVTLGTVVFERPHVLRAAALGAAATGADVLVTVGPDGDPAALGELPGNVRVERFVRQDLLLPHLDLIVHHCGSGTMLAGLALGIPQLALPQGADQFANAPALVAAGAGAMLMPDEITAEAVTVHARRLLEPGGPARAGARRVAGEIAAMPSPAAVARTLAELV